jgi:SAM-dependent methyltransferase
VPAKSAKDALIRTFWGDAFYRRVLQPFDAWRLEPSPSAAFDPHRVPLNKVCRVADAANPLWRRGYADLGFPEGHDRFHRKIWEFNQALYGLRTLRRLAPDSTALGIGCGHEELMYFLANRIRRVVATDLYEGSYLGGESDADVLEHPEKYAPFNYRAGHLEVRRMDGLSLDVPDASFDIVFCLSSIEHFGRTSDKLRALMEMFRVLKPGGVAVVTTELVLNRLGRGAQYFSAGTLASLTRQAGFVIDEPLDLRVEQEYAARALALPMDAFTTPHVVLRNFNTIYTSVSLFLMKPAGATATANAVAGEEVPLALDPHRYSAEIVLEDPPRLIAGKPFTVAATIRNAGNVTWFANPSRSHTVRAGAWFTTRDGRNLTGEPLRFPLPGHLRPGEQCTVTVRLVPPDRVDGLQLNLGLVKELCFWFRDKGSSDRTIALEYEGAAS